jgi:RNA-directed DNA polymerase
MNTVLPMYEWSDIPWQKLERNTYKLQKRIYKASNRGDVRTVRRLQKLITKSWSAKVLSVRRVTQDNQGKKTAGVDGIKSLSPKARLTLVNKLKLGTKAKPTRRVWIPKPGKEEKRPLGIPTMYDRALQGLVKLAIEPEWEARFEKNSYGFRPGRSCHDAIGGIFDAIKQKSKYVLDTDIEKCFDKINHIELLNKLSTYPTLRKQIKYWLKSGVMDGGKLFPSEEGCPQGGVISPLLSNIALHGIEKRLEKEIIKFKLYTPSGNLLSRTGKTKSLSYIRYADDFVLIHESIEVITTLKKNIEQWLNDIGLRLKESKTRICHTLEEYNGEKPGFDFLGFHIQQYKAGKHTSSKNGQGKVTGFKTIIKPSSEKIKQHNQRLKEVIKKHYGVSQIALIHHLNPIIKGWTNYYSHVVSKKNASPS